MKEVPIMDVFDTTDFNPEHILSSVFLDPGLDFVANIDDLGDSIMPPDLLQHLGNSVFYAENTPVTSNNQNIEGVTANECHQQLVQNQPHHQQQQTSLQQAATLTTSRVHATVEKHAEEQRYEPFASDYTKQLPSVVPLAMLIPAAQQQPPCKCEFCEYLQANRISLTGDHSFQCEFCGEGFSNQTSFNRHRCGSTDIQMYRCESCRREYGSSRALSSLGNCEQRDKCDLCNRSYEQSHTEGQAAYSASQVVLETVSTAHYPVKAPGFSINRIRSGETVASPAAVASSDVSNGSVSDRSAANVHSILGSPTENHDLSSIDPFGSDSECIGDFFATDATDVTDETSSPATGPISSSNPGANLGTPLSTATLHHPESAKTYFVLGNVDQLQQCQQLQTCSTNNTICKAQHATNGFHHLPLPTATVPHQQQPPHGSLQNAPSCTMLPSEHEVTSLQQYDQYDDEDYSSMSEDEAIVPIEPYAKSPNQEHAKTELPIQETIVDTSTSVPQFTGALVDGLSSAKVTSLSRLLVHGSGSQEHQQQHPLYHQHQQQLLMQQLDATVSGARLDDDEDGKCDSSSSLRPFSVEAVGKGLQQPAGAVSNSSTDRPYKCHICERSYRNQKNLKSHLKVHEGIRAYQCEICGKNFSGSSYLVIHRRRHTGERPFKCPTCGKAFVDSRALAVHTRLHSGERLKCDKCEKTFSSVSALTVHNRLHTGIHPYKCEVCGKTFPQYNNLKHHMKKHEAPSTTLPDKQLLQTSSNGVSTTTSSPSFSTIADVVTTAVVIVSENSPVAWRAASQNHDVSGQTVASSTTFEYKCHICSKLHKTSDDLQEHLNQHSKERPNQCEFCSKVFPRSSHLIIHRRRHTGERPFKCKYCDKAFVDSRALSVHTRLHTGERVKCEICEKTFASSSGLIVHRRIHTGVHPYKCDHCDKSFAQSTALKYHLKKHDTALLPTTTTSDAVGVAITEGLQHNGSLGATSQPLPGSSSLTGGISDRFKCSVCNKLFRSSEYLVRHRRTHSGERPYQCEICGKNFSTMSYLVIHRRRHTSERPYKCNSCEKAFVDSRALQEHARLHTGDRVRCEICQKTYSSVSNLIVHRRIHSGIHPFECDNCGKSFAQKNALKYHLKKHIKPT